jgi:hypothetical protein
LAEKIAAQRDKATGMTPDISKPNSSDQESGSSEVNDSDKPLQE